MNVKDDCVFDLNNPIYLKIAMRLACESIKERIAEGCENYVIAPDGTLITLPFVAKVVEGYADAI